MSTPGNGDYRLREIERRLQTLEDKGSPTVQRLEERLNNERDVRREVAADLRKKVDETTQALQKQLDEIDNTLTWGIRLFVGSVVLVIVGVLVAVLSGNPTG